MFRASIGRVPNSPDQWIPGMGVVGPMGRTVADTGLLLSAIAGHDQSVPLSMESPTAPFAGSLKADAKGKRIGWLGDFGGFAPCEPEVLATCRNALDAFTALGCTVDEARIDHPLEEAWQTFTQLRGWMQGGSIVDHYRDPARRAQLKPEALFEVETGLKLSAFDITRLSSARTAYTRAFRKLFEQFDFLVAPTAQMFPFDVRIDWPREVAGHPMHSYHEWMKVCCLVTLSGCPTLAVPAGFGPGKLPIGLQVIAPVHHELDCLVMGAAYEAASSWTSISPRLAAYS